MLPQDLSLTVCPHVLRFKQPAGTSRGVYRERKLWYIHVTSRSCPQLHGVGECAPLFDLSCDYTADYEERLRAFCQAVERTGAIDHEALRPFPSILFGLETALLSAEASLKGSSLKLYDTPFTRGAADIPINGLVWMGSYEEMLRRMEEKLEQGFRCVKLKIGAIDFEQEMTLIRRLRARFSREVVEIRVDANGGFSPAEAPKRLEELARQGLHSIEQPIRAGQWQEMAELCRQTPLPIALDEELIGVNETKAKCELLDAIRPQYIILKPTLHGGLSGAEEWMRLADARSIPYWATSALESNVGLNAIAQWTAAKVLASPQKGLPQFQGLGTGQLFETNFEGTRLTIEGDRLWIADKGQRDFEQELRGFKQAWADASPTMEVQTSGSTGTPKTMPVRKEHMAASAEMTCRALGLTAADTALLCMPLKYIAGQMLAVRCFVNGMKILPVAPSLHPLKHLFDTPTFAAMTPAQVFETLKVPAETEKLKRLRVLIIGGGSISEELAGELRLIDGVRIYSTYGMTETLSHVALRRLDGREAEEAYTPLPGVTLSLSQEGCLVITAPHIGVSGLATNDRAELRPDGKFRILGRRDNVICSGGLKIQAEELERRLSDLPVPFVITSVPDAQYGEAVTLLYAAATDLSEELQQLCRQRLERREVPKHYIRTDHLPLTATGKPARSEAKAVAFYGAGPR